MNSDVDIYIGVGIISLAIIMLLTLLLVGAAGAGRTGSSRVRGSRRPTPLTSPSYSYSNFTHDTAKSQPSILYHGTTLENALEIYTTGLWMIGYAIPPAVWMGDKIEIASCHSGSNGGIVTVSIDPDLPLKNRGGGIYIYEIPDARPKQEYYRIQGLTPTGVVSPQGNRIR